VRRDNKKGPTKKTHRHLKGNTHAKKAFARDGRLSCRFNTMLLELAKSEATAKGISLADWIERQVRRGLRDAGRIG